jgi:hypothetical protein
VRVLGSNCFSHDTAERLLADGRLVALAEEERFNRERHPKRFPEQAIGFCLAQAGIGVGELDVVAFATGRGWTWPGGWPTRCAGAPPSGWPSRPTSMPTLAGVTLGLNLRLVGWVGVAMSVVCDLKGAQGPSCSW